MLRAFNSIGNISDSFQLQKVKFLVSLLNVYISAAICARPNPEVTGSLQMPWNYLDIPIDYAQITLSDFIESQNLKVVQNVDFPKLENKLIELITSIVKKQSHSFEEKSIVSNALHLWMHC